MHDAEVDCRCWMEFGISSVARVAGAYEGKGGCGWAYTVMRRDLGLDAVGGEYGKETFIGTVFLISFNLQRMPAHMIQTAETLFLSWSNFVLLPVLVNIDSCCNGMIIFLGNQNSSFVASDALSLQLSCFQFQQSTTT